MRIFDQPSRSQKYGQLVSASASKTKAKDEIDAIMDEVLGGNPPVSPEVSVEREDGSVSPQSMDPETFYDEEGELPATTKPATAKKRILQRKLRNAQRSLAELRHTAEDMDMEMEEGMEEDEEIPARKSTAISRTISHLERKVSALGNKLRRLGKKRVSSEDDMMDDDTEMAEDHMDDDMEMSEDHMDDDMEMSEDMMDDDMEMGEDHMEDPEMAEDEEIEETPGPASTDEVKEEARIAKAEAQSLMKFANLLMRGTSPVRARKMLNRTSRLIDQRAIRLAKRVQSRRSKRSIRSKRFRRH